MQLQEKLIAVQDRLLQVRYDTLTNTSKYIDLCAALVVANVVDTSIKLWETFDDINDEHHKVEEDFTKKVVHDLRKEYPEYNVLVYHGESLC